MPIRYFSKKNTWGSRPVGRTEETLYAFGEPKDPKDQYEEVPFAEMTADHTPGSEEPNFGGDWRDLYESENHIVQQTGLSHSYMRRNNYDLYADAKVKFSLLKDRRKLLDNLNTYISDPNNAGNIDSAKNSLIRAKSSIRHTGIEYAKKISKLKKESPTELFTSIPEETTITAAFAHPDLRFTAPTLGAIFLKKHGELTASSDLSAFSSAFVRGAIKRGLPVKTSEFNPDADQTNQSQFNLHKVDYIPRWSKRPESGDEPVIQRELTDEEVTGAKEYMRGLLFPKKQSPVSTEQFGQQNTQPRLPGMSEGPMGSWY